jgi:hypothetical protein
MFIKIGNLKEGNPGIIEDYKKHGDICINTENCRIPIVIAFRADELHNLLMKLISNPEMTKIAVFPPYYSNDGMEGEKEKFLDSVPVPEAPEATKSAIKFLRKAAINKLLNNPDSFDVVVGRNKKSNVSTVVELGKGLDKI